MSNHLIILSLILQLALSGNAQENFRKEVDNIQSLSNVSTEKLHLHIDRNIFSPGEDIWFKAYLLEGTTHEAASSSTICM